VRRKARSQLVQIVDRRLAGRQLRGTLPDGDVIAERLEDKGMVRVTVGRIRRQQELLLEAEVLRPMLAPVGKEGRARLLRPGHVRHTHIVPLTIACLTMALALGLGTGAVFKLVPEWFPDRVGSVTGVVGAAGGLGGFFPPLVMGVVKSATGGYAVGFILMALVAVACLIVLSALRAPQKVPSSRPPPAASTKAT
jgi:MFS transporter